MGQYNSSLTRVRPFFKILIARDSSGCSWLPKILALTDNVGVLSDTLLEDPVPLHSRELDKERRLAPPEAFLRWLIQNPEKMSWPKGRRYGTETQKWRDMLMGRRDLSNEPQQLYAELRATDRAAAISEAMIGLQRLGSKGSAKKWWAFEGFPPSTATWQRVGCEYM